MGGKGAGGTCVPTGRVFRLTSPRVPRRGYPRGNRPPRSPPPSWCSAPFAWEPRMSQAQNRCTSTKTKLAGQEGPPPSSCVYSKASLRGLAVDCRVRARAVESKGFVSASQRVRYEAASGQSPRRLCPNGSGDAGRGRRREASWTCMSTNVAAELAPGFPSFRSESLHLAKAHVCRQGTSLPFSACQREGARQGDFPSTRRASRRRKKRSSPACFAKLEAHEIPPNPNGSKPVARDRTETPATVRRQDPTPFASQLVTFYTSSAKRVSDQP